MKLFSSVLLFLLVSAIFAQESNPTSVAQNEATPTETIKEQLPLIKPAHQIGDEEVEDSSSHDHANDTLKSENATSAAPEPEASTSDETFPPEVADNDPFQETTTTATLNQTLATTKTENEPQPPSESTENVNGTESHETQAATQPTELEIVHEETLETEKTEEVTSHEAETSTEEHEPEVSPTQSENVAAVNETMHVDPSATAVVAEATISHESEATTEAATISTNLSNFHIEEGPLGIRKLSAYPTNASETVVEETSTALDVESSMNPDDADVFAADKGLFSAEATMRTSTEQHVNQPVVNSSDPLFPRFELPQQNSSRVEETTSLNGEMKHVELGGNPDEITKSEESQSTTEEGELALPILPPKPTDQSDSSIADEHSENSAETVSESESTHGDADKILPTNTSVPDQTESAEPHAEPEPEPTASSDSTTEPKSEPEPSAEPEPSSPANHEHEHMQTEHDHFSTPEPEPKAEPEPSPLPNGESPGFEEEVEKTSHEHTTEESTAVPEPKSEPEPQPEPEPSAEPTPNETKPMGKEHVHPSQADMDNAHKTRFSLRFPNIDFSKDFENPNSGLFKKLRDQVSDDLRQMFISVLGDNFLDLEIVSMREGSVIIEGLILTKEELTSPEVVAAKLEEVISKNGAQLGANRVDLTSISVNGIFSKGLSDSSGSIVSTTNSGYIVFGAIAVGLLIIVFSVFAIILFGVNSRRTNGNLKLKEELNLAENGRSTYNANAGSVNLMGFGNTSKSPGLNGSSNNSNSNNKTTGASSTAPPMITVTDIRDGMFATDDCENVRDGCPSASS